MGLHNKEAYRVGLGLQVTFNPKAKARPCGSTGCASSGALLALLGQLLCPALAFGQKPGCVLRLRFSAPREPRRPARRTGVLLTRTAESSVCRYGRNR